MKRLLIKNMLPILCITIISTSRICYAASDASHKSAVSTMAVSEVDDIKKEKTISDIPEQPQDAFGKLNMTNTRDKLLRLAAPTEDPLPLRKREKIPAPRKKSKKQKPGLLVPFDFDNEDLSKIINQFAALRGVNIIQPTGAQAITQKITFDLGQKISLKRAERYLTIFLDLAGYSMVPRGDMYAIVKNDANVNRENLPLYVNVPTPKLPDSDERIRAVYYFQNIRVPENITAQDPLNVILNDTLSPARSVVYDIKSNGVIISDKARNIRSVMDILLTLDSTTDQETLKAIRLYYSSASTVATLLNTQILALTGNQQGNLRSDAKNETGLYFAPGTKIIADDRTNSLLMIGKEPALERIREFVQTYIDTPIDSGDSILHYYDLQYLDSETFAPVLKQIVQQQGASGQATQNIAGPRRGFEGVIIAAEIAKAQENVQSQSTTATDTSKQAAEVKGKIYIGGNRILVAARKYDWDRINKLIQELDRPQLQVIVQVMIVDIVADNNKIFGTQTRNPSWLNLPKGVEFQSAMLSAPILNTPPGPPATSKPTTLAADLLRLLLNSDGQELTNSIAVSLSTGSNNGSTILSFDDSNGSGIWSIIQWLSEFTLLKVLSHPYIVVQNNQRGETVVSDILRATGNAVNLQSSTVITVAVDDVTAALKVTVIPRASSLDRLSLQVAISIDQFVTADDPYSRITREINTNVNIDSGNVLVIGGLKRTIDTEVEYATPILGKIPVLKWFFSRSQSTKAVTNLAVFITPTIVEPKIRAGMNKYTHDKINDCYAKDIGGSLFDKCKDPITYLFFNDPQNDPARTLDEYLAGSKGDFVRPTNIHQYPSTATMNENCGCTSSGVKSTQE